VAWRQSEVCAERRRQQGKQVERPDHAPVGLEKLPEEALGGVDGDEDVEAGVQNQCAVAARGPQEGDEKDRNGRGLKELHGMARHAVAEVDARGSAMATP
jgi:hypothetical protein